MSNYNTPLLRNRATGRAGRSDPLDSDDDSTVGANLLGSESDAGGEDADASVRSESPGSRSDVSCAVDVNDSTPLLPRHRNSNVSSGGSGQQSASARPFVDTPRNKSSVETQYEAKGSILWIVAMTIGLKVNGLPLLCLDTEPFKSMVSRLGKRKTHPNGEILREEVIRRSKVMGVSVKPNNWSGAKATDWLDKNPVSDPAEVSFLCAQVEELSRLQTEPVVPAADDASRGKQWRHHLPFLRLMHCMIDNNVKDAFLHRAERKSQSQLDGRNSEVRQRQWFELAATMWANPNFNPKTKVLTLHEDFKDEIALDYEIVKEYAHPDAATCDSRFQQIKTAMYHVIKRWEASGAGDCGLMPSTEPPVEGLSVPVPAASLVETEVAEENPTEENPTNEMMESESAEEAEATEDITDPPSATVTQVPDSVSGPSRKWGHIRSYIYTTDNRASFLGSSPSYLLYLWDLLEANGMLSSSLQRFNNQVRSGSGGLDFTPLDSLSATRSQGVMSTTDTMVQEFCVQLITAIQTSDKTNHEERQRQYEKEKADAEERLEREKADRDYSDRLKFEREKQLQDRQVLVMEKKDVKARKVSIKNRLRPLKRKYNQTQSQEDYDDMKDVMDELAAAEDELKQIDDQLVGI